jgi:hypothetical protein
LGTVKVLCFFKVCGLVQLVAEDSASIEDRDLVRRQAVVLARHLPHLADPPPMCRLTCDREAARSIVRGRVSISSSPPGLKQRFHHIQMPTVRASGEAPLSDGVRG